MFGMNYRLNVLRWIVVIVVLTSGCSAVPQSDTAGPTVESITTSSKVLAKSDCIPTSLTITGDVTDNSGVKSVTLWYRVGSDQSFAAASMSQANGSQYTATIKALDIPGGEYGTFEFYIVAQDKAGNQTQSSTDKSVELTRCVG